MILTGPEIRLQTEAGKELHGKHKEVRLLGGHMHQLSQLHDSMDGIHIDPYDPELVGPNSVDLRLGDKLLVYSDVVKKYSDLAWWPLRKFGGVGKDNSPYYERKPLDMRKDNPTFEIPIPEDGIVLLPGILYLGTTVECIGSNAFVPIVEGRSSIGRLGLHVHVTAGFCDIGFKGQITLEIHVIHPIRVYADIAICQAYFLKPEGEIELYKGRYRDQVGPVASRLQLSKDEFGGE